MRKLSNHLIHLLTAAGLMLAVGCGGGESSGRGSSGLGNSGGGSASNSGSGGVSGSGDGSSGSGGTTLGPINISSCGNGKIDNNEECDDGNPNPGDGCVLCHIADGWVCPTPGQLCMIKTVCGDGKLAANEACDDGNTADGDGCSADCKTITPGYECRVPNRKCVPSCGDGLIVGSERCDDMNNVDGDGCSSTCLIEPGASCTGMPSVCSLAKCGNSKVEEGESCDLGAANGLFLGDGSGCSKSCTQEPICRGTGTMAPASGTTHACNTSCGNGSIEAGEDCDDGNLANGDGCSSACKVEPGFTCSTEMKTDLQDCTHSTGQCLELPVLYRDFKNESVAGGHPDFFFHGATIPYPAGVTAPSVTGVTGQTGAVSYTKRYCVPNSAGPAVSNDSTARCWDMAMTALDANGKPQFNTARNGGGGNAALCDCQFTDFSDNTNGGHVPGYATTNSPVGAFPTGGAQGHHWYKGPAPVVTSPTTFSQWWRNGAYESDGMAPNKYRVGNLELAAIGGNLYQYASPFHSVWGGFFPFDDILMNGYQLYQPVGALATQGTAPGTLTMTPAGEQLLCGVWPYWFSSTGFGDGAGCKAQQYILPPTASATTCDPNNWYNGCWMNGDGTVVQAWRHDSWFTTEARYLFTFNGAFSLDFYGDDDTFVFINGTLVIDLGGVHQRIPGHVDVGPDGNATYTWGGAIDPATNKITPCAATTRYPFQDPNATPQRMLAVGPDCRTGTIPLALQMGSTYEIAVFGADRGAPESNFQLTLSGFATNRSNCAPRCGDGIVTGAEECDCGDGTQASQPPECGGMVNAGTTAADTPYGGCTTTCKSGPYCGDGHIDNTNGGEEECDLGSRNNTGKYGDKDGCTSGCKKTHYCGDNIVDENEQCDSGTHNGEAGQRCTSACILGAM